MGATETSMEVWQITRVFVDSPQISRTINSWDDLPQEATFFILKDGGIGQCWTGKVLIREIIKETTRPRFSGITASGYVILPVADGKEDEIHYVEILPGIRVTGILRPGSTGTIPIPSTAFQRENFGHQACNVA